MAAMMPMIATTISSSMSVKPFCLFISIQPSFRHAPGWLPNAMQSPGRAPRSDKVFVSSPVAPARPLLD
jgi:hypothetical protein